MNMPSPSIGPRSAPVTHPSLWPTRYTCLGNSIHPVVKFAAPRMNFVAIRCGADGSSASARLALHRIRNTITLQDPRFMGRIIRHRPKNRQLASGTSFRYGSLRCADRSSVSWLRKTAFAFTGAPFIWVALEWLRTYLFSGLPWALLGYSQYQWLPVIQIADHTGVYGVSFLVVLVNAALAELALWTLERRRGQTPGTFPRLSPAAAVLGMAIALLYGLWDLGHPPQVGEGTRSISIGLV